MPDKVGKFLSPCSWDRVNGWMATTCVLRQHFLGGASNEWVELEWHLISFPNTCTTPGHGYPSVETGLAGEMVGRIRLHDFSAMGWTRSLLQAGPSSRNAFVGTQLLFRIVLNIIPVFSQGHQSLGSLVMHVL